MLAGLPGRLVGSCLCIFTTTMMRLGMYSRAGLHVRAATELLEVRAGSAIVVPRGTAHTYCNPDPTAVRYLLVMTSNIYALIREIHSTSDRSPATMRRIFEKHDSELL
jgi:hypothetical protein